MYIRTVKSGNHEYVQLAHNYRDPETGVTRAKILYNFGRKERQNVEELRRLVNSISQYLVPDDSADGLKLSLKSTNYEFLRAKELGTCWLLNEMWGQMGIRSVFERLLLERKYAKSIERLIFALVVYGSFPLAGEFGLERWILEKVFLPGLTATDAEHLSLAFGFLHDTAPEIQKRVSEQVIEQFDLHSQLIFLETGSWPGSSDTVIAWAVTWSGIPVRYWMWPDGISEQEMLVAVNKDLDAKDLGGVVAAHHGGWRLIELRKLLQAVANEEQREGQILLGWLVLLLRRIIEQKTKQMWPQLQKVLSTLQVGIVKTPEGQILQTGQINHEVKEIYNTLGVKEPHKYLNVFVREE